jgi:hypothetical protein
MGPWAWNHLLAWGGPEMLSRGGGVKNGLQGGRMATYPPPRTPMFATKTGFQKPISLYFLHL